jgi:catalase
MKTPNTTTASLNQRIGNGGETHQHVPHDVDHADGDLHLTTNHGVRISDNQNSLRAGERGPTLLEDFVLREKIFHFDHERIPERIVHARGSGAHGVFECTKEYQSSPRPACSKRKETVFRCSAAFPRSLAVRAQLIHRATCAALP